MRERWHDSEPDGLDKPAAAVRGVFPAPGRAARLQSAPGAESPMVDAVVPNAVVASTVVASTVMASTGCAGRRPDHRGQSRTVAARGLIARSWAPRRAAMARRRPRLREGQPGLAAR